MQNIFVKNTKDVKAAYSTVKGHSKPDNGGKKAGPPPPPQPPKK